MLRLDSVLISRSTEFYIYIHIRAILGYTEAQKFHNISKSRKLLLIWQLMQTRLRHDLTRSCCQETPRNKQKKKKKEESRAVCNSG